MSKKEIDLKAEGEQAMAEAEKEELTTKGILSVSLPVFAFVVGVVWWVISDDAPGPPAGPSPQYGQNPFYPCYRQTG